MDALLLVSFMLASAPQTTGVALHEWISFLFLVPFMIHILLHWRWIITTPLKFFGRSSGDARFNTLWDLTLYLMMVFVVLSGLLISEVALPVLGVAIEPGNFWFTMHHNCSNLLMPMLGIHLALHWSWIVRMIRSALSRQAQPEGN